MQSILVSVIIPVYNGSSTIERCVNSLKAQTLRECEFIFVDDCSSDDTIEKLNSLTRNDSRFIILRQEKRSDPFQSRKKGIKTATGKYIMFLDADDTFIPKACEKAYKTIINKDVDLVLFGSKPISTKSTSKKEFREYIEYVKLQNKINGNYRTKEECYALYFKKADFGFITSLAQKIFKASILKSVINKLNPTLYLGYGQDLYQLIATITQTSSIYANNHLVLHNYFIGDGVTQLNQSYISIEKYRRIISSANTYKAIEDFIFSSSLETEEKQNALDCAKNALLISAQRHLWCLPDDELANGINMLHTAWNQDYLNGLPLEDNVKRFEKFILNNSQTFDCIIDDIFKAFPILLSNTIERMKQKSDIYKNSISYKLGYVITTPFRWINNLLNW